MRILSFGEIVFDVFPDAEALGGAPLNFAAHAAAQGCEATLLSAVGDDALGDRALCAIEALGLSTAAITRVSGVPSGRCDVTLDAQGLPRYQLAVHSAYDHIEANTTLGASCDALCFGTLALRAEHNRTVIDTLLERYRPTHVFVDLNIRPPYYSTEVIDFCLRRATILKVSDEDLALVRECLPGVGETDENTVAYLTRQYPSLALILLTRGAAGASVYDAHTGIHTDCPAERTEVVSTVGAGDSYAATFLCQYNKNADILRAMQRASEVSAFVISHRSAIPDGIRKFIRETSKND